jgi:Integrase zinc binding domain
MLGGMSGSAPSTPIDASKPASMLGGTSSTQGPSNGTLDAQTTPHDQWSQTVAASVAHESENPADKQSQINIPDDEQVGFNGSIPDTSLIGTMSGGRDGIDLLKSIANKYLDDPFFKNISEHQREFKNFEVTKGRLVYLKVRGRKLVCIPKVIVNGRNIQEIVISEAHSLLAHLGANKTLDYLWDHVWWKEMVYDTRIYCETCQTCKRSKLANRKPYGLLNPLQSWAVHGTQLESTLLVPCLNLKIEMGYLTPLWL